MLSTLSMHSCTNHATLPTSSHCIEFFKLDMGRPAKRNFMSLVLSHENNKCSSSSIIVYSVLSIYFMYSYACMHVSCNSTSRNVSGLTPTAVFALATPKSPIDRGWRWQLQLILYCNLFCFLVLLSDTHQGRVWNQITQPELVAKPWQRRESNPRPLDVVGSFRDLHQPRCLYTAVTLVCRHGCVKLSSVHSLIGPQLGHSATLQYS
jgi:hypothetical protein